MTIAEQIHLFNRLTPFEFMEFSFEMKKRNIDLPIFWYVRICLKDRTGQHMTVKDHAFIQKWHPVFSRINLTDYISAMKYQEITEENGDEFVKDIFRSLREEIKRDPGSTENSERSALLKLLEEIRDNVDFSSKDRKTKGLGYSQLKFRELLMLTKEFKEYRFELQNITIRLTAKQFIHILIGHAKDYLVPRKGRMVLFEGISHWQEVLFLIMSVIPLLQHEIEAHFSVSTQEYNNTSITFDNKKFGIHISRKGEIKTFYPLPPSA